MNGAPERLPIRSLQRSMVLSSLRAPASGIYVMQEVCELPEKVDASVLRRAWQVAARRYPALRCQIELDGANPVSLLCHENCDVEWRELDWTAMPPEAQRVELDRLLREDRRRGFDFRSGIPIRFTVIFTSPCASTLVWTSHHALLDGRSYVIVWREWLAAYDSLIRDGEIRAADPAGSEPVPALPDPLRAEQYWRDCFDGISQTTEYILDRIGPAAAPDDKRFAKESAFFSEESAEQVRGFARDCGVSVNTVVQGAWALLLSRYSSRRNVVFGVTRAGRNAAAGEVGLFINTLPFRVTISADSRTRPWLRQIRSRALAMREFEQTPVDQISKWSGLPAGMPPFESVLVFEHETPQAALRALGGRWGNVTIRRHQRTDTPLTLAAYGSPVLSLELVFDAHLFSTRMMRAAMDQLKTLIEGFIAQPDARPSELNMLTETEQRWLGEQNRACAAENPERCAHELFEDQVRRTPGNVALDGPGGSISYDELNQRANRLAWYLREAGMRAEALIAIAMEPSAETIVAILAVLKAGAAFLPLDPSFPEQRLEAMIADARPKLVLRDGGPIPEGRSSENLPNVATPADAAYAIYTSGSTGKPKAVVVPHRALANHTFGACLAYGIRQTDRRLQFASVGTDVFVAELFNYLCSGATLVLGWNRKGSVREFLRFLEARRITITGIPSAWFNEWVAAMEHGDLAAPQSLRAAIIGMEKANPASIRIWEKTVGSRVRLFNAYGPAETSPTATVYEAGSSAWDSEWFVPIGRPIANMRVYVLDGDGNQVPVGVPGQLYLGGPGVARGYLNSPEQTAERFVPDRFCDDPDSRLYATGDIVFMLPDANLVFLGRANRQVKIRGFRVELDEIEAALAAHPAVRQCAVISNRDGAGKHGLAGFVTFHGLHATAASLRSFLSKSLPQHMLPAVFVPMAELPMTAGGKIDRQALALLDLPKSPIEPELPEPTTPAEKQMAEIWKEVLGVSRVSATDNFFELGGDSLQATRLITFLETHFAREIPLAVLWRAPTLSRMAAMMEEGGGSETQAAIPLQPHGSRIPFFCLPGADENPLYFLCLAQSLGPDQPFYVLRDPRSLEERGVYTVEETVERLIAVLKSVQPEGPYIVGGHCYGGIVAFEMARQLVARGDQVGLVVLFEVAAPGYPKVVRHWKKYGRQAISLLQRDRRVAFGEANAHLRVLRKLFRRKAAMVRRRLLIGAGLKRVVEPLEKRKHPNWQAGLSYEPKPVACDVIQFIAAAERHSTRILPDPRLAWNEFTRGRFTIRETPGAADAIFKLPHVQELAALLSEALNGVNQAREAAQIYSA